MWKVLGTEAPILKADSVLREEVLKGSRRRKGRARFVAMLEKADFNHFFDTQEELHVFFVTLPRETSPDDVRFFGEFLGRVVKSFERPVIELDGVAQPFTVVVTAEEEEDVYRKASESAESR